MLFEDILGSAVSRGDNAVDFLIDLCGSLLGIVLQVRIISAEEHFVVARAEGYRAELLAHAVLRDHLARYIRSALDIVRRAGRDIADYQRFGNSAAEQADKIIEHLVL